MTNKELLKILELAQANNIKEGTLRILLNVLESKEEIKKEQLIQLKFLLKESDINDEILLKILEKSCHYNNTNWNFIKKLNSHPAIKEYLSHQDFFKDVWRNILEFVSKLPQSPVLDSVYIKWLKYIQNESENLTLSELKWFHKIMKESISSPLSHSNWYFTYLLDPKKEHREEIFNLLKQNIFNMLSEGVNIDQVEIKAQKIVECYQLYGYTLASKYATIIACIIDLDIPLIENDLEKKIYLGLYNVILCLPDSTASNFLNSLYYKLVIDKSIHPLKRLLFMQNLGDTIAQKLLLKDDIIAILWQIYEKEDQKAMEILKYAFSNNGIRHNALCRTFLKNETNKQVLELARQVFLINRVRQDTASLQILNFLKTSEEKIEFLHSLDEKYPDNTEKQRAKNKQKEEQTQKLLETYTSFLEKNVDLKQLTNVLNASDNLDINLTRIRRKRNE